ncbi:MAG TPA: Flp pilus assembly protein CpaB [Candidatus Limnocylindria bacterium]|nr:Flp pilus assembly protein CpaB [Candidatus Limnocylindria bacterium]
MIGQRALLAIALVCGVVAGTIYYGSVQRVSIVVAARPLDADKAIAAADLTSKQLPPDAVPDGALRSADEAIGRVPRAPHWPGQIILGPALAAGAAAFHSGLLPPAGQRAVAIPVTPSQAMGGALAAGAHVDVIAVPILGRAPAGRMTELVAANVTVLDVRGEAGGPFVSADQGRGPGLSIDRLGSVVVALAPVDELRVADRISTSTFVLVFIPVRE